jgi:uncharacterized membrane protein
MYTKARIAGHPIHPMLVAFPIGLYAVTVAAMIAVAATHALFWYHVATLASITGVVMAVVAAIFGFADFLGLPRSRARTTAIRHMAANVVALVLFGLAAIVLGTNWWGGRARLDIGAPLVLSIGGLVSTVIAGWFGWTLVQTHHVGVRPTQQHGLGTADEVDDLDELIAPPPAIAQPGRNEVLHIS